jgi:hypothetical protein
MKQKENKAPAIIGDRFGIVLLAKPITSPSGRIVFFLGSHYDGKQTCFDVGAAKMAQRPIEVIRRHHYTKEDALVTWSKVQEDLKRIEEMPNEREGESFIVHEPKKNRIQ